MNYMDYSIPANAKYAGFAHIPFVFGARHILFGIHAPGISVGVRISHVALGLLECILPPVAGLDYLIHRVSVRNRYNVVINGATPYERGKQFGEKFKDETKDLYKLVLSQFERDANFKKERVQLLNNISSALREEMQGLADGAGVSFDDVVDIHTLVDIRAGQFGCSSLAVRERAERIERVAAANHFNYELELSIRPEESIKRQFALFKAPIDSTTESLKNAIAQTSVENTIQSIVFDPVGGEVHLATGWSHAAKNGWKKEKLFNDESSEKFSVKLVRNLDWPWMFLGPKTIVVKTEPGNGEPPFVNVTFPGYLGVLSGMNQNIAIAANQSGSSKQNGMPLTLLFREVIQKAGSTQDALSILESHQPASAMNLTIAGKDRIVVAEIDPYRKKKGFAGILSPTPAGINS